MIDLRFNYPILGSQHDLLIKGLDALSPTSEVRSNSIAPGRGIRPTPRFERPVAGATLEYGINPYLTRLFSIFAWMINAGSTDDYSRINTRR